MSNNKKKRFFITQDLIKIDHNQVRYDICLKMCKDLAFNEDFFKCNEEESLNQITKCLSEFKIPGVEAPSISRFEFTQKNENDETLEKIKVEVLLHDKKFKFLLTKELVVWK